MVEYVMAEQCNEWPSPLHPREKWRYTTAENMLGLVDWDIITHGKAKDE
jgi:hypothetical protein